MSYSLSAINFVNNYFKIEPSTLLLTKGIKIIGKAFSNTALAIAAIVEGIFFTFSALLQAPFLIFHKQINAITMHFSNTLNAVTAAVKGIFGYVTTTSSPWPIKKEKIKVKNKLSRELIVQIYQLAVGISLCLGIAFTNKELGKRLFLEHLPVTFIGTTAYTYFETYKINKMKKELLTNFAIIYFSISLYENFKYHLFKPL